LQPHKVRRIVQPPPTARLLAADGEPLPPDEHQQGGALTQRVLDVVGEAHAHRDVIHILEDVLPAEACYQAVVDASRKRGAVGAPVGDEDLAHPVLLSTPQYSSVLLSTSRAWLTMPGPLSHPRAGRSQAGEQACRPRVGGGRLVIGASPA